MFKFKSLGILIIAASAGLAYAESRGVKEYGISRGEPITDSFLFWNGKYVKAPYVVERRGLGIYINNIVVVPESNWAFYDYTVKTDPGDPPKNSSPFDPRPPGADDRESYWAKKWRYLHSHFEHDKAKQMMFETYQKSTELTKVSWSEDNPDIVKLTHKSGKMLAMDLSAGSDALGITEKKKKEILDAAEKMRLTHEKRICGGVALFTKARLYYSIPKEQAVDAIEILMLKQSKMEKITALEKIGLLKPDNKGRTTTWIVEDFQVGVGLKEQLARVKKIREAEAKIAASQADTPEDNSGDTTTETPSPKPDTPENNGSTETPPPPPPTPVEPPPTPPTPVTPTPAAPTTPVSPPAVNNQQTNSTSSASNKDKGFPTGHVIMAVIGLIVVFGLIRFLRQRRLNGT